MMSKVIGYLFYTVFYEHDFFLFLNRKRSLTSDVEQGFMAIAGVSNVGGNTAKNSSIWLLHPGDLQDTHGEKRVPGLDRQREKKKWLFVRGRIGHRAKDIGSRKKKRFSILPFIWCADGHTIFLPCDAGLRNTVHLALKTCHSSLIHRHGFWMSVKLRQSCMDQIDRQVSPLKKKMA